MNSAGMRVWCWLASFLLAIAVCNAGFALYTSVREIGDVKSLPIAFVAMVSAMVLLGLPGWLAALPAVIGFRDLRRWRFWVLLALEMAAGTICLLVISGFTGSGFIGSGFSWSGFNWLLGLLQASLSAVSALIYLASLRRLRYLEQRANDNSTAENAEV